MTRDYDFDNPMEQFLLCTSCTISYIFGNPDDFVGDVKATEMMSFKHEAPEVPVQFVETNLQLYANDDDETPYSFWMDIGYIHPEYQSDTYFVYHKENMLGLAPMILKEDDDQSLLTR